MKIASATEGTILAIPREPNADAHAGLLRIHALGDGSRAAASFADGLAVIIDRDAPTAPAHVSVRGFLTTCVLVRAGAQVVVGQKTLTRFDAATRKRRGSYALSEDAACALESADGRRLFTCDRGGLLRTFDLESGEMLAERAQVERRDAGRSLYAIEEAAIAPSGHLLARRGGWQLLNVETLELIGERRDDAPERGRVLVLGWDARGLVASRKDDVVRVDPATLAVETILDLAPIRERAGLTPSHELVAWSPSGRGVLWSSTFAERATLYLVDLDRDGDVLAMADVGSESARPPLISADGRTVWAHGQMAPHLWQLP